MARAGPDFFNPCFGWAHPTRETAHCCSLHKSTPCVFIYVSLRYLITLSSTSFLYGMGKEIIVGTRRKKVSTLLFIPSLFIQHRRNLPFLDNVFDLRSCEMIHLHMLILFFSYLACNCNGFSSRCYFDQALYDTTGHGGHCLDCSANRDGPNCERCRENFYQREDNYCVSCNCDETGKIFFNIFSWINLKL